MGSIVFRFCTVQSRTELSCGITLHAVALLFYKGERHPKPSGIFPALFGDQYRRYRRQPRMLIFTTGRVHRRVDRTAPASADAADRIPAGPLEQLISWHWGTRYGGARQSRRLRRRLRPARTLLEAAKKVLRQKGYAALSTRDVAAAAGVPLSQIHYHFGSKHRDGAGAVRIPQRAAARPSERHVRRQQSKTVGAMGSGLRLSRRRHRLGLCARAAGADRRKLGPTLLSPKWFAPRLMQWVDLIVGTSAQGGARAWWPRPLTPEEIGAFAVNAFIGAESLYLLGLEKKGSPVPQALRRVGDLVRSAEAGQSKR